MRSARAMTKDSFGDREKALEKQARRGALTLCARLGGGLTARGVCICICAVLQQERRDIAAGARRRPRHEVARVTLRAGRGAQKLLGKLKAQADATDEDHALGVKTTERIRLHKIIDKYKMSEADIEGACRRWLLAGWGFRGGT